MVIVYGLKNCDSCRATMKALKQAGVEASLHDLRADGVEADQIQRWLDVLGSAHLLNRKSTTWRGLDADQRARSEGAGVAQLLSEHPTLIKRPILETPDGGIHAKFEQGNFSSPS